MHFFVLSRCLLLHHRRTEEQVQPPLRSSRPKTQPFQLQRPHQNPPNLLLLLLHRERVKGRGPNPDTGRIKPPSPNPRMPTGSPSPSNRILILRSRRSQQKRRRGKSPGNFQLTCHSAICTVQKTRLTNGRRRAKEAAAAPRHRHPRAAASRLPALDVAPHTQEEGTQTTVVLLGELNTGGGCWSVFVCGPKVLGVLELGHSNQ